MKDTLRPVPLSVLSLALVGSGKSVGQALRETVALAQHVEGLGYSRFWLAEHHNMPGIASSAPAVVIGQVAAATRSLRVGSGGVMLPNHAPLVIAEQFGTLEALFPGRIDLGLGRAPGTDQNTARALRRTPDSLPSPQGEDFSEQLGELFGFFRGSFPEGHPFHSILACPGQGNAPPIWLLGSSGYSAQLAGMLGLPFAFAHHFSAQNTEPALELYRRSFRPSEMLARPYALIAVHVVCAASDESAAFLARPSALSFLRLRAGRPGRLPTPEEAAAHPWTAMENDLAAERHRAQAVGGPETVKRRLADLLERTQADELMVLTMVHDPADARASYDRVRALFPATLPEALAERRVG